MRFLTDMIKKLDFGWNERPLTEDDFYRLCKRFKIHVEETPLHTRGFYFRLMGRDIIAVDSRLAGHRKRAVMFHELGHFLFHIPETGLSANFHNIGRRTRKECEADTFALCALIPKPTTETRSVTDLIQEGFPAEMIAARHEIFRRYRI
ncbi:MAG: ImmA/IrrE family metallo-endopeptidase [Pyrinomonadaceae bacterium]